MNEWTTEISRDILLPASVDQAETNKESLCLFAKTLREISLHIIAFGKIIV